MEPDTENTFGREIEPMPGTVERSTPGQSETQVMQPAYEMTTHLERSSLEQNQSHSLQEPQANVGTRRISTTGSSCGESAEDLVLPFDYNISSDFFTWAKMTMGKVIGSGMTGSVVLATKVTNPDMKLAVKIFDMNTQANSYRNSRLYRKEISALRKLNYPHIMYGVKGVLGPDHLYIVMPFFPRGDLSGRLIDITEHQAWRFFFQLGSAVSHLYLNLVAHLDIKLENILLKKENHIILTDFGLSQILPNHDCTIYKEGGTKTYWAPECFQEDERVNPFKVDVYATGVVLWELVFRKLATSRKSCLSQLQARKDISFYYRAFIKALLERDAEKRLTMPEFMIKMDNTLKQNKKVEEKGQSSSNTSK